MGGQLPPKTGGQFDRILHPIEERKEFYDRTVSLRGAQFKADNNEFFIEYDYNIPRNTISGIEPSKGIDIVSIFLTVCGKQPMNLNQGLFFIDSNGEYVSAGLYTMPYEYRFYTRVQYSEEDLRHLKTLWPLFKSQFQSNPTFALVARRFFYSALKVLPEDRLIDLIIGLEALLVPEEHGSKKKELAQRLSTLVASHFDRESVAELCIDLYEKRNAIIHGNSITEIHKALLDEFSIYTKVAIEEYLLQYSGLNSKDLVVALNRTSLPQSK